MRQLALLLSDASVLLATARRNEADRASPPHLNIDVVRLALWAAVCDHECDGARIGVLVAAPLHCTDSRSVSQAAYINSSHLG